MDILPFVERAAGFLVQHAPITHQERWEETAGYSPSTLAAVIAGLICAARLSASARFDGAGRVSEEYADWIERHLEDWTVTNDGVLHPEVKRHYMRDPAAGDRARPMPAKAARTRSIHIEQPARRATR